MQISLVNTPDVEIISNENLAKFEVNGVLIDPADMSAYLADLVMNKGVPEKIIYDFNDAMLNNGQGIGSLTCHDNSDRITAGAFRIIDGD